MKRVILIVLDSVGVGELPDAAAFGDVGSNTLGHIAAKMNLRIPNLLAMGLGNLPGLGLPANSAASAAFGRAAEQSRGKDTITGHWEIAGLVPDMVFPYFPEGFPREIMDRFEQEIGTRTIGNYPASGTVIIDELGEEHMRTGYPIVYTSSDSVFQIAMHEEVIPIERQYRICEIARGLLQGDWAVGRVIARPFIGKPGGFMRTANRHDFSIDPPSDTILDYLMGAGKRVYGVGKIMDIFNGRGISGNKKSKDNQEGIDNTLAWMKVDFEGLVFTNLVDFDMHYGHRRDVEGYGRCIEEFDARLPEILAALGPDDVLMLTADHGNDPTYKGTDHTREYVPVLVHGQHVRAGVDMGTRATFADMGATILDMLGVEGETKGVSFWGMIRKEGAV
ncbi:MAG: phosphopentomutase [Bacteroidia bacterium]